MAQSRAEFDSQFQHRITREALAAVGEFGFVLAGAGALREHGLIDRPTEDIDLFTIQKHEQDFPHAVDTLMTTLRDAGLEVTATQVTDSFARLHVSDRRASAYTTIDMGVDWRSSAPATLQVGAVLAEIDSVASKVAALYSRGEPRDFLDVDRIRQSGRFSDEELLEVAVNFDPGFDRSYFAHRLSTVSSIAAREVHEYGVSSDAFESIAKRLEVWGRQLTKPHSPQEPGLGSSPTKPHISPPAKPWEGPGMSGPERGLEL